MSLSWKTVDAVAAELGASDWARRKWKQRGTIPPAWKIRITQVLSAAGSPVELSEFDRLEREAA